MENEPTGGNPFYAILGRALGDLEYRQRLIGGNATEQIEALREMGVTNPEASLEELNKAVTALESFYNSFEEPLAGARFVS